MRLRIEASPSVPFCACLPENRYDGLYQQISRCDPHTATALPGHLSQMQILRSHPDLLIPSMGERNQRAAGGGGSAFGWPRRPGTLGYVAWLSGGAGGGHPRMLWDILKLSACSE